ncbi:MAG: T9SS type A sorting domain-containing protein [Bacteroidota bacterium]
MKPILFMILIMLCTSIGIFGQTVSRSVISSGGEQKNDPASGLQLSWTIGEISTELLENQSTLQLGFQQAEIDILVNVQSKLLPDALWKVFPNPADFMVEIQCPFAGQWQYFLTDPLGQTVISGYSNDQSHQVELPMISDGLYLLTIQKDQKQIATRKLFILQNN